MAQGHIFLSVVLKGKKIKVLTHRPRYIETTTVPKFGEGTSSTVEAEQAAPAGRSAEDRLQYRRFLQPDRPGC
jgi:hypothetical protein